MDRVHVVISLDAAIARDAIDGAPHPDVLARARADRHVRRRTTATALDPARRAELDEALAGEPTLAATLGGAPDTVRAWCLGTATRRARQLQALVGLRAPAVVLDGLRRAIAAALTSLDLASPLDDDPPDDDPSSSLHVWCDELLRAARRDVLLIPMASGDDAAAHDLRLAEGAEHTTLGMWPARAIWLPPEVVLPRALPGDAAIAAGLGGGPPTFALAGDPIDPRVAPALHARFAQLAPGLALASFVWVPNDVELAWDDDA